MKKSIYIFMTALLAVCMTSCGPIENTQTNETAVTEVTYAAPETTAKGEETKAEVSETKPAETKTAEKKETVKETVKETKSSAEKTDSAKKAESSNKTESSKNTENTKKTDDNKKAEETKKADGANKYGYYTVPEPLQTSISVKSLTGDWTDGGSALEFADCDLLKGKFHAFGGDKSVSGTVVLEYTLNPDNTKEYWFNLYDDDGEFYKGFKATGEIPFNDLYTGQSGEQHFTRMTEDPTADDFLGPWVNGGVEANITKNGSTYTVMIYWPEMEGTITSWEYNCYYDEASHELVCNGQGKCTDSKRSDGGTFTDEIKYENASAVFSITDGCLGWQDDNDDRDDGWAFARSWMFN